MEAPLTPETQCRWIDQNGHEQQPLEWRYIRLAATSSADPTQNTPKTTLILPAGANEWKPISHYLRTEEAHKAHLREEKKKAAAPPEPKDQSKLLILAISLIGLSFILMLSVKFIGSPSSDQDKQAAKKTHDPETLAKTAMIGWFRDHLKDADHDIEQLGPVNKRKDGTGYVSTATVTAKNSFGVKMRKTFIFQISNSYTVTSASEY